MRFFTTPDERLIERTRLIKDNQDLKNICQQILSNILEVDQINIIIGYLDLGWYELVHCSDLCPVELEIGGGSIERHYGDWLDIWNELQPNPTHKKLYEIKPKNIREHSKSSVIKPKGGWGR